MNKAKNQKIEILIIAFYYEKSYNIHAWDFNA